MSGVAPPSAGSEIPLPGLTREQVVDLLQRGGNGGVDLSCFSLPRNLERMSFVDVSFTSADGSNLANLDFEESTFLRCSFVGDNSLKAPTTGIVEPPTLLEVSFNRCTFEDTTLRSATLQHCDLRRTTFRRSTLAYAILEDCDLYRSVWESGTVTEMMRIRLANLHQADLGGSSLALCNLQGPLLHECEGELAAFQRRVKRVSDARIPFEVRKGLIDAIHVYRHLSGVFAGRGEFRDAADSYVRAKRLERRLAWRTLTELDADSRELDRRLEGPSRVRALPQVVGLSIADLLCRFGESATRVLLALVLLLVAVALLLCLVDGAIGADGMPSGLFPSLQLSFETLVGSSSDVRLRSGVAEVLIAVERIVGTGLVGLFGFVLGNKIRFS